jgi:hypothetical protein
MLNVGDQTGRHYLTDLTDSGDVHTRQASGDERVDIKVNGIGTDDLIAMVKRHMKDRHPNTTRSDAEILQFIRRLTGHA